MQPFARSECEMAIGVRAYNLVQPQLRPKLLALLARPLSH